MNNKYVKRCSICRCYKLLDQFNKSRSGKSNRRKPYCIICHEIKNGLYKCPIKNTNFIINFDG